MPVSTGPTLVVGPLTIDDPAYFDRLAEVEAAHWWSLGMWRLASHWLRSALRGRRGLRALDVGCGAGLMLARLATRPEIAEVVGLEPSPEALSRASGRGRTHPLIQGDARALPFPAASFDLVSCLDVFQHLPAGSDRQAAAELRRVLRPGGIALIRSNARGWSCAVAEPDGPPGPYRLAELVAVTTSAGLRVRRATLANCLPALAQELRGRFRSGRAGPGHPAGGGLRIQVPPPGLNRLMGGISSVEAFLAGRLGTPLPFGHSTLLLAEAPGLDRGIPDS